jgi:hypothetical protein
MRKEAELSKGRAAPVPVDRDRAGEAPRDLAEKLKRYGR